MIGYLKGEIAYVDPTHFIIDVNGVGYEVKISLNTYIRFKDHKHCKIYTYLYIKEDAHILYGFYDQHEKWLFSLLITVSGVGPSTAIMMLSSMNVSEIQDAIAMEDVGLIKTVKGIGSKTAERVILELKDKIKKGIAVEKTSDVPVNQMNLLKNEARTALVTLGFQKSMGEKSIHSILKNANKDITLEEVIKLALKSS
ncbi:MAG: Holliday junction branch migration protein RuvA [Cyclobacteriaceae bacterium]|nr:Holliday junction branch migration protein RuvA [Cyclobacteriaceae bacterium]